MFASPNSTPFVWAIALSAMLSVAATPAIAFAFRGEFSYSSARQCTTIGQIQPDRCDNAEKNAAAEFEEKAPHFPTRDLCERLFKGCSIGFGGGGKRGIYFTPRQSGFKIKVRSSDEMVVTPVGPGYFRSRSILKRETSIDPRVGREAREAFEAAQRRSAPGAAGAPATFGQSEPDAAIDPNIKPVINNDPNFDCAAVLEPSAKGDPNTGCYLAPPRR